MKILERWAGIVIGRRAWVVGAVLALTAVAAYGAGKVRLNADFSTYLKQSNPLVRLYDYVGDTFGNNSIGVVLLTAPDVFQPDVVELTDRLTEAYRDVEGIAYVTSLTNVVDFRRAWGGIEVGRLIGRGELPRSEADARRLEARVMAKDRLVGTLVSEDGTAAAILLRFGARGGGRAPAEYETATRVKAATDAVTGSAGLPADTGLYFGGMPFLVYNMTLLIAENMVVLTPLMLGVLLLVLFVGIRRWGGVFYPLSVVLVSTTWTVGLMGFTGARMDLLTGIMPVVLIALGSADGIHYMKRFYERRAAGDDPPEAARTSLVEMGVPLVLTTLTTMVGFASLAISDFAVIRQFGLLTALGLLLALVVTLTLLPALGSWGAGRPHRTAGTRGGGWTRGLARFVHRRTGTILAGSGAVVVAALVAIPRIVKDVDWTLCLERGSAPFHAEMLLREKFGGSLPIQVLVDGDLKDPVTLTAVRAVERRLGALPLASRSQSIAGIIAEMNDVLNERYAVPSEPAGVGNLWFLIEDEELMEQLVAGEDQQGLVQARLADWTTATVSRAVDSLSAFLATFPSRLVVVDPGTVPADRRPALQAVRRSELAQALRWDMARWDLPVPLEAVEARLDPFLEWEPGEADYAALGEGIRSYLVSAESEVPLDAAEAGALAGRVVEFWRAPGPEALEGAVRRALPGTDPLDAEDLALSLRLLGDDVLGRARVGTGLAALGRLTPALEDRPHLRRDVRGTLWEAMQPLQALDARTAGELGIVGGPAEVRTVEVRFERAGMASVLDQMEEELLPTQISSILLTLGVVVVVLGLVFHTVFGGALALAPLVLTILVNFAVMGYAGVGLDAFTAMVASIAVGLGIDYAIHFTHRFRREWARSAPDMEKTLRETFATSGVAILVNAASVGLGFLVLLGAGGQHIRRFGGLTALTMLVAGALTLTLLPALFVRFRPRFVVPGARRPERRGRPEKEDTMRPLAEGIMKGTAGLALLLALAPSPARAQDGRAILERVDSVVNAFVDVSAVERMTLIDEDGSEKERRMRFHQKGPEMRIMHFLEPADVRDVGFLRLAEDRMYLYLPAFRRVRRIASSIQNEDFMGTDFSYEDLSRTSYGDDYEVTAVEESKVGESYRLTLEPRKGADVSYRRLELEVGPPDWVPETVDFYGPDGERIKTLTSSEVELIDGYWFAKRLEMVSWRSGHRTVLRMEELRFDTGLSDDVFTERSLKRPR